MVDAREYHERTKHSPRSVREDDFRLDRRNRPRPYKVFEDLPRRPLGAVHAVRQPALSTVAESGADPLAGAEQPPPEPPDRETLATLCYEAGGVVKTVEMDGREMPFRAASCTGKLYHVDLYVVAGGGPDLDAGVYHFDPRTFAFDVLREGDYRGLLAAATGGYDAVAEAPVTVVATSTWWRNAWKYRERTYRHAFWDSGTVLANLLAAAHALDYRAEVVTGVADHPLVELLGLDPTHEAPLEAVALGGGGPGAGGHPPDAPAVEPVGSATEPLSDRVVDYPVVHAAWESSALADGEEARTWREQVQDAGTVGRTGESGEHADGERVPLEAVDHETASARPLHHTVVRRGSCRSYADAPVGRRRVATVLDRATRGVPADWNAGGRTGSAPAEGLQYNEVYCLLTDVEGVPDGTYRYHPGAAELERLGAVDERTKTHLALDQRWAGEAHVNVYLMADIERVVERMGNRGYRLAQLEAGITLGRLYLAAYAHRDLGGTGLTFYDDEVTDHLSPAAADRTPTCLFAFGEAAE
jgi:SagB-type dehydrogenase family enzyme